MAKVWLVRLGEYGEGEAVALATGVLATTWELPNFSAPIERSDILGLLEQAYRAEKRGTLNNWSIQLNQLCNKVQEGDLTITPLKTASRQIAIGRVTGSFFLSNGKNPSRRVNWLVKDLPRDVIKQDLLYSLGASQTVCEISRNNAVYRFEEIVKTGSDTGNSGISVSSAIDEDAALDETVDLAELARDQIERHIASTFVGHGFTRLIASILEADGYQTTISPPGSDKGIDIVAGQGPLGFGGPRLVVQVKSGSIVADQPTLQSLIGCVQDLQAEHGLLVSWSGFKSSVRQRSNDLYFRVRLWGREEIVSALFRTYDRLPETIKADLPLQRVWIYLPQDERK